MRRRISKVTKKMKQLEQENKELREYASRLFATLQNVIQRQKTGKLLGLRFLYNRQDCLSSKSSQTVFRRLRRSYGNTWNDFNHLFRPLRHMGDNWHDWAITIGQLYAKQPKPLSVSEVWLWLYFDRNLSVVICLIIAWFTRSLPPLLQLAKGHDYLVPNCKLVYRLNKRKCLRKLLFK